MHHPLRFGPGQKFGNVQGAVEPERGAFECLKHGAELPGPTKESLESGAAGHPGGQDQYWCGLEQSADWKRQAEDGASRYHGNQENPRESREENTCSAQ